MTPPAGSGVLASIPAIWRARLLTHVLWPSDPLSAIGRAVDRASRYFLSATVPCGSSPTGFQYCTTSQPSGSWSTDASSNAVR